MVDELQAIGPSGNSTRVEGENFGGMVKMLTGWMVVGRAISSKVLFPGYVLVCQIVNSCLFGSSGGQDRSDSSSSCCWWSREWSKAIVISVHVHTWDRVSGKGFVWGRTCLLEFLFNNLGLKHERTGVSPEVNGRWDKPKLIFGAIAFGSGNIFN